MRYLILIIIFSLLSCGGGAYIKESGSVLIDANSIEAKGGNVTIISTASSSPVLYEESPSMEKLKYVKNVLSVFRGKKLYKGFEKTFQDISDDLEDIYLYEEANGETVFSMKVKAISNMFDSYISTDRSDMSFDMFIESIITEIILAMISYEKRRLN